MILILLYVNDDALWLALFLPNYLMPINVQSAYKDQLQKKIRR